MRAKKKPAKAAPVKAEKDYNKKYVNKVLLRLEKNENEKLQRIKKQIGATTDSKALMHALVRHEALTKQLEEFQTKYYEASDKLTNYSKAITNYTGAQAGLTQALHYKPRVGKGGNYLMDTDDE